MTGVAVATLLAMIVLGLGFLHTRDALIALVEQRPITVLILDAYAGPASAERLARALPRSAAARRGIAGPAGAPASAVETAGGEDRGLAIDRATETADFDPIADAALSVDGEPMAVGGPEPGMVEDPPGTVQLAAQSGDRGARASDAPQPPAVAATRAIRPELGRESRVLPSPTYVWPARGLITTYFGEVSGYSPRGHSGIDLSAPWGTPVEAVAGGRVALAGWSSGGYGNRVAIDHLDGVQTFYAHLARVDVEPGQRVRRGQQIGLVGSTGFSTGPHLHFEVREAGALRNPLRYLP